MSLVVPPSSGSGIPPLPDRYNYPGAARVDRGQARVAALDGLRGIAIAGVVAFHTGVLPGGFLGVDLFFVLSGFLITGLLLREQRETGTVALREFWTRRARRLVPAVLVLVAAAQVWAHTHALPSELSVLNGQSLAATVYLSNWYNILFSVGYWSVGPSHSPLNHLWSLAIEEQFYVVFPLLFVLWLSRAKFSTASFAWLGLALACVSLLLTPLLYALVGANRAYFGTDTRIGAILIGVALASVLIRNRSVAAVAQSPPVAMQRAIGVARFLPAAAVIAAIAIVALWIVASTTAPWLYRGGLALHALASAALIAAVVLHPNGIACRLLQARPLVWLGERSYSLYLWHWPLLVIMTPASVGLKGFALAAAVTGAIFAATIVSYELVEHPIRYSRLRGARLVASLAVPALGIAVSALTFQPAPPPQFGSEALITQGRGGIHVMLVGDSWARNLGVALARVDSTHRLSILNMGKGGCGIADAKRERTADKGDFDTPADCLMWPDTWSITAKSVRPEVAILNVGNWDQTPQDFDGTGTFVGACDALFRERYSRQLDKAVAVLGAHGATVFVMTVRDNDAREGSGPDCMNVLLRETVTRHAAEGVQLMDLYAQLCREHVCPDTVDGERVYDETGHLAATAQRRIATWVLNTVNGVAPRSTDSAGRR